MKEEEQRHTAEGVKRYHTKDDVDSSTRAHHHTLGMGLFQAARGSDLKDLRLAYDLHAFYQSIIETSFLRRTNSTDQAIANATTTKLAFATSEDSSSYIAVDAGNDDFTVTNAGVYRVDTYCTWEPGSTGRRILSIKENGAEQARVNSRHNDGNPLSQHVSAEFRCAANAVITVEVLHDQGASLNVNPAAISIKRTA